MAKQRVEAALRSAFETLVTAEEDSHEQFEAESVILELGQDNAALVQRVLESLPDDQRKVAMQALAVTAQANEEITDDEWDDDTAMTECALAEADIAEDVSVFEPEEQGTLAAQIRYAFGFMTANELDCSDAQEDAMKFLRQQRKRNPVEFFAALKLLANSSQQLAFKVFKIDVD